MIRLIYFSTAVQPFSIQDARDLVDHASLRNRERNITGVLSFNGHSFCQLLEGPEKNVVELMDKIMADPRHQRVSILRKRPTQNRLYAKWSMELEIVHDIQDFISRHV